MTDSEKLEWMNRRRRQMHIHSVLYYHLGTIIISDETFDRWARELAEFQKKNPIVARHGYRPEIFWDWTGETGIHLPVDDIIVRQARKLIDATDSSVMDDFWIRHDENKHLFRKAV